MGTLAIALALAVAAPSAPGGARERSDAETGGAPRPATPHEAPRSVPDDRTARELALLHQHALRDPFAGPPAADLHARSPDLRDPFVPARADVEPLPSPDLRDPFVDVVRPPRTTAPTPAPARPRIDACRPELDGVPLQRARVLPPPPPACDVAPAPRGSPPPPPPSAPKRPSAATHAGVATLRA